MTTESDTSKKTTRTVTFGPTIRFRALEGDRAILLKAASKAGQTLSAYLRDAAMSQALTDLNCDTREQATRKVQRRQIVTREQ